MAEGHLIRGEVVDVVGEGCFLDWIDEEGEMRSHCQSRSVDDADPGSRVGYRICPYSCLGG